MKIFGFTGTSGSGKTTLIESLMPYWLRQGLRVSVIKHTHHGFDLDQPGKDSWRHRQAGAGEVMLVSANRWALLHENRAGGQPDLSDCLARLEPCDLVVVEGFKRDPIPKLEVYRPEHGKPALYPDHACIVAVAMPAPLGLCDAPQVLDLADLPGIAQWVLDSAVAWPSPLPVV